MKFRRGWPTTLVTVAPATSASACAWLDAVPPAAVACGTMTMREDVCVCGAVAGDHIDGVYGCDRYRPRLLARLTRLLRWLRHTCAVNCRKRQSEGRP